MRPSFVLNGAGGLLFIALAVTAAAQPGLLVEDVPVLRTDQSGTVSVPIVLRNGGTDAVAIHLNVSDFEHEAADGSTYALGATFAWTGSGAADKSVLNGLPLKAGGELTLKLTISRLWEAGESIAILRNGDSDIPTASGQKQCVLHAVHVPDAFNVHLDLAGNTPELDFDALGTGEQQFLVRVVNADPMTYRFRWALQLDEELRTPTKDVLELPPNGSAYIDLASVAPRPANFGAYVSQFFTRGTLKDELSTGSIVLTPIIARAHVPPLAPKILPVTARLRFWTDGLQEFMNLISVFLLLTAGGIASIWVHCGMPNTSRALELQRRLRAVDAQVAALGGDIASEWRVLLAGRARALCDQLQSTWWVFPAFADVVARAANELTMLEAWTAVAYDVSIVLRQTRIHAQDGIPPTILHRIEDACEEALSPIDSGRTNDEELQGMRAAVRHARNLLDFLESGKPIPELEEEIARREKRLALRSNRSWPPEFVNLVKHVVDTMNTDLSPDVYQDRDTLSLKVDLLNDFLGLCERAQEAAPAAAAAVATGGSVGANPPVLTAAAPSNMLIGLEAYRGRLFDYLRPDAPESLRMARLFVAEMRQNIYEPELIAEVRKQPPGVQVLSEPAKINRGTCVHFLLWFRRPLLNDAAARQEWTCTWNFGDGCPPETGWDVHHSFEREGNYNLTVEISDLRGEPVTQQPLTRIVNVGDELAVANPGWRTNVRRVLRRIARIWKPHAETILEASRLALVLAVAVFGLVTTARQQASALTLPEAIGAVIALGFGADTLKNLITDKTAAR